MLYKNSLNEYFRILTEWTEPNGFKYVRIQNIRTEECFNINRDLLDLMEVYEEIQNKI